MLAHSSAQRKGAPRRFEVVGTRLWGTTDLKVTTRPGETALFHATVGDFNDAWLAIVANDVGVGGVMVRVK